MPEVGNYALDENYAWELELSHWYEFRQIDESATEMNYNWNSLWVYSWGNISKFVESSFTFPIRKSNLLITNDAVYIDWEYHASIDDTPILDYRDGYMVTSKWVFRFISDLSGTKDWVRDNKIHILRVPNVDQNSFKIWSNEITSDVNHVYHNNWIVDWLEWSTFELLAYPYFKSNWELYVWRPRKEEFQIVSDVDTESFIVLWNWYSKDKNQVYYTYAYNWADVWITISIDADADTFELTKSNSYYAKDNVAVYYKGSIVSNEVDSFTSYAWQYWKDSVNLYCFGNVVSWVDVNTIQLVHSPYDNKTIKYLKDKNNVYISTGESCRKYLELDGESFELLTSGYFKDKDVVYFGGDKTEAEASTFEIIQDPEWSGRFSKDAWSLYYFWEKIDQFDVDSFIIHWYWYFTDDFWVYYMNNSWGIDSIKWIDQGTFEVIWVWYFKDKNHVYFQDVYGDVFEVEWADLNSFKILIESRLSFANYDMTMTPTYASDINSVYKDWKIIEWADPLLFDGNIDDI